MQSSLFACLRLKTLSSRWLSFQADTLGFKNRIETDSLFEEKEKKKFLNTLIFFFKEEETDGNFHIHIVSFAYRNFSIYKVLLT